LKCERRRGETCCAVGVARQELYLQAEKFSRNSEKLFRLL
jgi:hypothetical protein